MSIRSVVTMGFSNGTFSEDASLVPTLGYSIGQVLFDDTSEVYRPGRVGRQSSYRGSLPAATDSYRPSSPSQSGLYRPDRQS